MRLASPFTDSILFYKISLTMKYYLLVRSRMMIIKFNIASYYYHSTLLMIQKYYPNTKTQTNLSYIFFH